MVTALIIIGFFAVLLTIISWFTPLSDNSVDFSTTVPTPLGSPEFFLAAESIAGSASYPILKDEPVTILNNGKEFVPDLLNEIQNAKHSITLANYIWKKGTLTNQIFDAITAKAKEGVQVRVIMDATASLKAPHDKIEAFEKAGGKMEKFRPFGLRTITRMNKRTHLRAMVIDGIVGYTGGVAFDDEWLGDGTKPDEWRDIMFKFQGQGARSIQNMFNALWRQTSGEILSGPDFYPELPPSVVSDPCTDSCFIPLLQIPSPDLEKNLSQFLWISIMGAKDHVYIETPYLLPDKNILSALKQKVEEGVRVDIIIPGPHVDSRIVQLATRSYYKEVLSMGVHLYEYQPAHMHSKIMTADGHWSVIGSANLDNRSSTLNVEGMFGVEDKTLAKGIEEQFELDKSRSVEITDQSFVATIRDRIFGRISRLFAKQY
ncbi:MAG: cardiolipin synthase [Parcubacteria group bacterium]|nr:cardiolipin synthase [Parcubacteria group bacterium]